jgi:hypothetical protein
MPSFGLGALLALVVFIVALIFLIVGAPAHFDDWVLSGFAALALSRLLP